MRTRTLFRYTDGMLDRSRVAIASLLAALAVVGVVLLLLPTSQPNKPIVLPPATTGADTALVYTTINDNGPQHAVRVGTYVWQAGGNFSGASQLVNDEAAPVGDTSTQRVTLNLRPGQIVTGAYTCGTTTCADPARFSSTATNATIDVPWGTYFVVLVQGGWSQKPGNPLLSSATGLKQVFDQAVERDIDGLGETVPTA